MTTIKDKIKDFARDVYLIGVDYNESGKDENEALDDIDARLDELMDDLKEYFE